MTVIGTRLPKTTPVSSGEMINKMANTVIMKIIPLTNIDTFVDRES